MASLLVLVVALLYGSKLSAYQLLLAAVITVIGTLPIVAYLRQPAGRYPMGQFSLLYHALSYGLVCFSSHIDWLGLRPEVVDDALELSLLGMVGLWLGFQISNKAPSTASDRFAGIPLAKTFKPALALVIIGALRYVLPALNNVPTLPHILTAGSWLGIALLLTGYLRGELPKLYQLVLVGELLIEGSYRLASGSLANLALLFLVIGFVFWRERGRIPIVPVVLGIATLAVFNPVKSAWRDRIWFTNEQVGTVEKLTVLIDLTEDYYLNGRHPNNDAAERNVNRLANTPTLAWATYISPSLVDYWHGYSYNALWFSLVPRFLYPDKPVATIGNEFGRRYRLLGDNDFVTSYNLPWLVECYVNFGQFWVLPGMLIAGLLLGRVTAVLGGVCSDVKYAIGLAATHPLFFADSNFALMWGNVILSMVFFTLAARVWFRR